MLGLGLVLALAVYTVQAGDKGYLSNGCDVVTMDSLAPTNVSQDWSLLYQWTFSVSNGCSPNTIVEAAMLFGPQLVFNMTLPIYGAGWQGSLSGGQLGFSYAIGWAPVPGLGGQPIQKGQTLGGFGFTMTIPHTTVHWGTYVVKNGVYQLSGEGGFNL